MLMKKAVFKGTEGAERTLWVQAGRSIENALEARGYSVRRTDSEENPWSKLDELVTVGGRLNKTESAYQLFVTADQETFELVWEAVEMLYPDATCTWKTIKRPA